MARTPKFNIAAAPVVEAKKKATRTKKQVPMAGPELVGALTVVLALTTDMLNREKAKIKDGPMLDYFVAEGLRIQSQPENIDGIENGHIAVLQLRKRGSNMALSAEEAMICTKEGIPTTTVEAPFQINPDYMPGGAHFDEDKFAKFETAIGKLVSRGDIPADIIVRAGADRTIMTDDSISAVFKMPENTIRVLLPMCSVMSIGPKFNIIDDNISPAINIVAKAMGKPGLREILVAVAKEPNKTLNPKRG